MASNLIEIVAGLNSVDESERCYAIEDLHKVDDSEAISYLVLALQDRSVRVREAAVDALSTMGGQAVADITANLLGSEEVPLRNAAIEILEKLGQLSLNSLQKHIHSSSVDIRKFSLDTIGKLISQGTESNPDLFSALIERLSDEDVNVAGAAAEALGFTKNDLAIPFLIKHLSGSGSASSSTPSASWLQCNIIVALSRISSTKSQEATRQIDKSKLSNEANIYLAMAIAGEVL